MKKGKLEHEIRYMLPLFRKELKITNNLDDKTKEVLRDERTHILATCMAAYPFTPTKELAEEFKTNPKVISAVASYYGIHKMKAMRQTINSENAKHVKNRPVQFTGRAVEQVARNGRVVATFSCARDAAKVLGVSRSQVTDRCSGRTKSYLHGYRFRYKSDGLSQP